MAGVIRCVWIFACIFAVHFLYTQQVLCSQGLTRNPERLGINHANFVAHLFHYLNVSQVGSSLVNDITDCAFACLRVVTCFSYNVAAYPDVGDRILCELLASDKYNSSDKFEANPLFHHFTINNPCSKGPCVNGGKCIALYSPNVFTCECRPGFKGKKCENESVSLSDSEILKGHADYVAKLTEYLTSVQVSGKQWKLCFRASEHQYSSAAFHAACDNKGPTVTLVRVGIYVFGGYTDKSWNGNNGYMYSAAAFLFSLKNHLNQQYKMLTYRYQQNAMYSSNSYGPTFGGGHDLYIVDNCNINNCRTNLGNTYSAPNGYAYGSSQAKAVLAGSYYFICDEYEVFCQI